ncbi:MAG TPA: MaoC family dehydratase [Burkholderiaceae bacterium]|nr:MaoC family dehydratase [Burkholderiaceae bacterium]HRP27661.1 MaoC family dehydratase [Burkholderiaceae bacterium]
MPTSHPPQPLFLDDLAAGDVFESEPITLSAGQIVDFARQFDPQPFHLDDEAARGTFFQGLAASGWHTVALTMRLMVQSIPLDCGVIGAGAELAWPKAVRPGDSLRVTSTVLGITPSRSKPDRGIVEVQSVTSNQLGEVVQRLTSKLLVFRRAA